MLLDHVDCGLEEDFYKVSKYSETLEVMKKVLFSIIQCWKKIIYEH